MLRLDPILPFLLLLLPFLLSLPTYPQSEAASSDSGYQRCKEPYKYPCGKNEYNISYPFMVGDEWEDCGHPDYLLKCSSEGDDGNLTISINDTDFNVLNINYTSGILTVAQQDINLVEESTCKIKNDLGNTSIDTALFNLTPPDINLTLLNCQSVSFHPPLTPNLSQIKCTASKPLPLYLVLGPLPTNNAAVMAGCTPTTLVIKGPPVNNPLFLNTPGLLQEALHKGFDIEWTTGHEWCALCLQSRGMCGFNKNNPQELTCYCPDGTTGVASCPKHKGLNKAVKIGIGFAGLGLGIIVTGFVGVFVLRYRKRRLEKRNSSMTSSFFKSVTPSASSFGFGGGDEESPGSGYYKTPMFTYEELEEATGGFSHELGDGGFGTVYKGKLKDGRVVAIKCLHQNTFRRVQQFRNEIEILNRLRHQNLVTLYGCSTRESPKLLLIYEFVSNGTVADHLHGHLSTQRALTWSLRMSVAIESAAALAYLHAVKPQIIHRDVKTTNILLDSDFHVKVADFGLSRLFPDLGVTHVSTAPQGTPGYVDPEYHQCYQLTDKSDVYSFGVVLVELVSSMPAVDISRNRNEINLSNMAIQKIPAGLVGDLADAGLGYGSDSEVTRMVNAVCELAFRCLQQERDMRPSMQEVLDELVRIKGGGDSWGGGKKPGQHDKEKNSSRDDVYLLNTISQSGSSPPFSPNTINGTSWPSRSTATNASC